MFVLGLATTVYAQEPPVFEAASVRIAAVVGRCRRSKIVRFFLVVLLPPLFELLLLLHLPAMAQNGPPNDFQFEVLSIRPTDADPSPRTARFGVMNPDPDGFDSLLSVGQMIMLAYGPVETYSWGTVEMRNGPSWDHGKLYHINAKVSKADLRAWQHQGRQHELLRAAMRAALRVRCKLEIHEQPSKGETFELVVAKGGARLKPTDPANDPRPTVPIEPSLRGGGVIVKTVNGRQVRTYYVDLPGGGVEVSPTGMQIRQGFEPVHTYYNATMNDLTDALKPELCTE
jgi:uncharacterized protein (TIGR03435 family)